jgi:hypothetical protein
MGEEEGGQYDCVATTRLDTVSSCPAFLKVQGRYTVTINMLQWTRKVLTGLTKKQ